MKVQPVFLRRPFPNTYIFPAFSVTQIAKIIFQFSPKSLLGMQGRIIRKSAKIVEVLQVDFSPHPHFSCNQIPLFSFKVFYNVFLGLFVCFKVWQHLLFDIIFAHAFWHTLALKIQLLKVFFFGNGAF